MLQSLDTSTPAATLSACHMAVDSCRRTSNGDGVWDHLPESRALRVVGLFQGHELNRTHCST